MAISRFATSSVAQGLPKYQKLWDGTSEVLKQFESIATVSVGSGGQTYVEFTSIPQGYKHLQLRYNAFWTNASSEIGVAFNSDTSDGNYHRAGFYGNYSGYAAYSQTATNTRSIGYTRTTSTDYPTTSIVDMLDYSSTTKSKNIRILNGQDFNGTGTVAINSLLWGTSNAGISSIKIQPVTGSIANKSHFALYGIKG
jgi:hypothetical protein